MLCSRSRDATLNFLASPWNDGDCHSDFNLPQSPAFHLTCLIISALQCRPNMKTPRLPL